MLYSWLSCHDLRRGISRVQLLSDVVLDDSSEFGIIQVLELFDGCILYDSDITRTYSAGLMFLAILDLSIQNISSMGLNCGVY